MLKLTNAEITAQLKPIILEKIKRLTVEKTNMTEAQFVAALTNGTFNGVPTAILTAVISELKAEGKVQDV